MGYLGKYFKKCLTPVRLFAWRIVIGKRRGGGGNMDKGENLREGGEGADSAEKRIDRARRAGEKRKRTRSYGNASPYPLPIE